MCLCIECLMSPKPFGGRRVGLGIAKEGDAEAVQMSIRNVVQGRPLSFSNICMTCMVANLVLLFLLAII